MQRLFLLFLTPLSLSAQLKRFEFSQIKMGSPFNIIFYYSDSTGAVQLAKECFLMVDSLNRIFSDYDSASEASRLPEQANQPVKLSDELFSIILLSKHAWVKSGKTFDVSMGALTQLWRKAGKEKRFPAAEEINTAKAVSGFENVVINEADKSISFKKPGIRFDFGGIVKGYAAQQVIDYLKTKHISAALADAGGDIAMSETPPGKSGWRIAINLPGSETAYWDKKPELQNCAVATSGDVYRYSIHEGKKYSHIIDPRSGYGVTSQRNVTVIAADGATADWLATACSILPVKKAMRLARKENAALFMTMLKGEKVIIYKSRKSDDYF
jgi:thiamine biosynthesis lipoprotein